MRGISESISHSLADSVDHVGLSCLISPMLQQGTHELWKQPLLPNPVHSPEHALPSFKWASFRGICTTWDGTQIRLVKTQKKPLKHSQSSGSKSYNN